MAAPSKSLIRRRIGSGLAPSDSRMKMASDKTASQVHRGSNKVVLAATLSATGRIPVAGVALILGIHRFMGEAMAVTNLIGNGVATIVVGKWCGQLDEGQLTRRLADGKDEKLRGSAPTPWP